MHNLTMMSRYVYLLFHCLPVLFSCANNGKQRFFLLFIVVNGTCIDRISHKHANEKIISTINRSTVQYSHGILKELYAWNKFRFFSYFLQRRFLTEKIIDSQWTPIWADTDQDFWISHTFFENSWLNNFSWKSDNIQADYLLQSEIIVEYMYHTSWIDISSHK